ncbi:hypothetical protein BOX15_Mlig016222g2 [Macrostomum lignano]|uniref:Uncharacterized protein n=2 Tax=Macrostomum lignano TaxID=282301 RepID=A0A267G552_9PLAT|nr:hypothetical protein BOX15_Mlig016222g1 [Macrostomum lignano]PAA80577.1 hypothetical protein BOX15_Mlig016222g2 [Macrostomum lignano]
MTSVAIESFLDPSNSSSQEAYSRSQQTNALVAVKWINYHQIEDNHDDSKILVCGSGSQIKCFLELLESVCEQRTIKRLICAADCELVMLTDSKFWTDYGCRIVSWRKEEYEDDIVRRTRLAAKQKPVFTVIDFEPTLRRLHRQFYIVAECGRVLLYQKRQARWKEICAPLLPALADRGVVVENLEDDCRYLMPAEDRDCAGSEASSDDLAYSSSMSSSDFPECDR